MLNGRDYGAKTANPWWETDADQVHGEVFRAYEFLEDNQSDHREAMHHWMSLYSNRLANALGGFQYLVYPGGERLRLNVTKAVVDTAAAHIASNRPLPKYLTFNGDYARHKRVRNLGKFVAGAFHQTKQHIKVSQRVFFDGAVFGKGLNKVSERGGRICSERVLPLEIQVDHREWLYSEGRQMFQHKELERHHLKKLAKLHWKGKEEKIDQATLVKERSTETNLLADPVSVIEAWILPTEPDSDDGRHVVACSSCVLVDEVWKSATFPIVGWSWCDAPIGYWGIGLVEELSSIQTEINMLLIRAQEALNFSSMQVWMHKAERNTRITTKPGSVNYYTKQPPTSLTVGGIPPQIVDQIERLYARAFEIAGVSQLAATSKKPQGLNSGAAIREYNDTQSQRFMHIGQRWEQFHLDISEEMISRAREVQERGDGSIKVLAANNQEIEQIDFEDVAMPRDEYMVRAYPASILPDTPAGQIDTITELAQANPKMAEYLTQQLESPDIEHFNSLVNSPIEIIDLMVEQMLEHGEPQHPRPYMDLELTLSRTTLHLLRAERYGADEDKLELLRNFLSETEKLARPPEPPPAPPGMPPPGMPPQQPGAEMMPPPPMAAGMLPQ